MRHRSDSAAQATRSSPSVGPSTRSSSTSDLKRGMGIWVWSRRPARIVRSNGDGTYEVEYRGEAEFSSTVERNDLDPMDVEERSEYLLKPRLEPDGNAPMEERRAPIRKLMDEWPISRAQMVKLLGFSPPKVDRLIGEQYLPLEVAVLISTIFEVEVDPEVVNVNEREHLEEALAAAREGAKEVQRQGKKPRSP